jgi:AraC family transcriptional regulator
MPDDACKNEYWRRIHRVEDYVEANLTRSFTLEELAAVAGFSKFHFHRIFKGIANESLWQYVNRIKLERAAAVLAHRAELTVTDIAYHFGFTDSAVFCRAFKNYYGISPTGYRKQYRKIRKDPASISQYNESLASHKDESEETKVQGNVEILTMEEIRVAYVRFTGTYQDLAAVFPGLLRKLYDFACLHPVLESGETGLLAIYHDNHEFTNQQQLRTSLCMIIPNDVIIAENSDIGSMTIPSGKYAVGHFEIFQREYPAAWNFMYAEWLSNSYYQPRDSFPFELYLNNPNDHPQGKSLVDIYLPIEPLGEI